MQALSVELWHFKTDAKEVVEKVRRVRIIRPWGAEQASAQLSKFQSWA